MFRILVTKVRAYNYASASIVNRRGAVVPQDYPIVVRFPEKFEGAIDEGTVWEVDGTWDFKTFKTKSGMTIAEKLYTLSIVERVSPEGQTLAIWIEKNIKGIGAATAVKLVRGVSNLNEVVLAGDIDTLLKIDGMSEVKAHNLIIGWPDKRIYDAIKFLCHCGLPPKLAEPITRVYGGCTEDIIKQDPYLLVPMGVSFFDVEALISRLDIDITQEAREAALAEDIVHSISMKGSTVVSLNSIKRKAFSLGFSVSHQIAEHAVKIGTLVRVGSGYQTIGMARMEAVVGQSITRYLDRPKGQFSLYAGWENEITKERILEKLAYVESSQLGFELTPEQREAVVGSVLSTVCCISGGAGVGKTTILKAILGVYEALEPQGMSINLLALSGRAAMRMAECSGQPAMTIAKFIYESTAGESGKKHNRVDQSLVVIDEASMIDLHTMYRLVSLLPEVTRLIFIGDTAQLPPVGCGLVFHEIVKTRVPTYHLTVIKRQGEDSGIHKLATQIRNGICPCLEQEKIHDVKWLPDTSLGLIELCWREEGGAKNAIILCPTNSHQFGVDEINNYIQRSLGLERARLYYVDNNCKKLPWRVKGRYLHLGDQVMVTQNDYVYDIRNGDIATITHVYSDFIEGEYGPIFGLMVLEGRTIEITSDVIDKLDLGFAVTIHKSQGSQWRSVLLVLSNEARNMTDRSLLYTAVTRPQERLIIFGTRMLIEAAITSGNAADKRKVGLGEMFVS